MNQPYPKPHTRNPTPEPPRKTFCRKPEVKNFYQLLDKTGEINANIKKVCPMGISQAVRQRVLVPPFPRFES